MKLISYLPQRLSFAVFAVCIFLAANSAGQDFRTVHDGVEYAEVTRQLADKEPVKINLLRLDLTKVRLDVHHALDKAIGLETTSSIAARHGAVAAINAGFFRLDKSEFAGDASDFLVIDGEMLSEGNRSRVGLHIINGKKKTEIAMNRFNINSWLGSFDSRFNMRLSGANRLRGESELVIFSPRFGKTIPSTGKGTDIVIDNCRRTSKRWKNLIFCRQVELRHDAIGTAIPSNGFVISTGKERSKERELLLNELKIYELSGIKDRSLYIRIEDSVGKFTNFSVENDLIAGVPQLIRNGKIDITWEQEKASKSFVETRHPRTAVAKMKDGKFLMMTVDGRQPGVSVGMNLHELAEYLLSLGAVDAMNLDGGGSTTMFLDGKVVNKPSDKEGERKVGDAILVTLRKRSQTRKR